MIRFEWSAIEEFDNFYKNYQKLRELGRYVFNAFKEAGLLEYGKYACFEYIELDDTTLKEIAIRYYDNGYDIHEVSMLYVPISVLKSEEELNKYIQQKVKQQQDNIEAIRLNKLKEQEEKEFLEYQRLKEKYENDLN